MQFQSGNQEEEPDRVLPLLNVVFLLLIFIIMTGALHAVDYFNVNPPSSSSEYQASLDDTVILISLRSDGSVAVGSRPVAKQALRSVMTAKLAGNSDQRVVIRSEPGVPLQRAINTLDLLRTLGATNVSLARKR